jgi:AcrR family transcriptional regulator
MPGMPGLSMKMTCGLMAAISDLSSALRSGGTARPNETRSIPSMSNRLATSREKSLVPRALKPRSRSPATKTTFFRFFPAKEAAGIEAETELWSAYLAALEERSFSVGVLAELQNTMVATLSELDGEWDKRYVATRRLIAAEPALFHYVEWYRASVKNQVVDCLAGKLGLEPDDLRLYLLAELVVAALSVSGRPWVRNGGRGGRRALIERFEGAITAIPSSLELAGATSDGRSPR